MTIEAKGGKENGDLGASRRIHAALVIPIGRAWYFFGQHQPSATAKLQF